MADEWQADEESWGEQTRRREESILIVDDDPSIRAMLGFVFEDEGYQVRDASDGAEALDELTNPPDAMILDLMMPRVDGHGVLRRRRDDGLAPETRVLVLTAKAEARDAVWCWELGADEFLNKPVDPEKLLREVQMLLKRTPDELAHRRAEGLAEAQRLDAIEAAFDGKRRR